MQNESLQDRKVFTWENLNYHVPTANGPLRLLHDVQGYVKPGTLTALMGASGAGRSFSQRLYSMQRLKTSVLTGKTTCLDVLAQRKNIGVVSGDILVDGRPLTSDFARGTAYGGYSCIMTERILKVNLCRPAEQMDVHEGSL